MNRVWSIALVLLVVVASSGIVLAAPAVWVVVIPTHKLPSARVDLQGAGITYTTFGLETICLGGDRLLAFSKKVSSAVDPVELKSDQRLWLITTKDPTQQVVSFPGVRLIWKGHGFRVVMADETAEMGLAKKISSDFTRVDPLPTNATVLTPPRKPLKKLPNDATGALLERLDREAFAADLKALTDLKTRYTYSDSARKAIDYCEKVMKELGLSTRRLPFKSTGAPAENLEGTQVGFDPGNAGEVIVIGHLDSTSPQASTLAPGADDNGSGAAGVLSLARFMKGLKGRASVRFIVVLGEEQGILGSKAYVAAMKPEELARLRAVINMDMIGFDAQPPLSTMLETAQFCEPMVQQMQDLAARYTSMTTTVSYNPWGSDHVPFLKKQIPTILTIESEFDSNPTYHKTTDTLEKVNLDLCHQILRLNAATLAEIAAIERTR